MIDIQWDLVGQALASGTYNLLLGAGVSLDSRSGIDGEFCPSAGGLRDDLQQRIVGVRSGSTLSRLYKAMNDSQKQELITDRFKNCKPGPTVQAVSCFRWKRIFTFNVDDALEAAYETASLPPQKVNSLTFDDYYSENRNSGIVPIIHLHGYVRKAEAGYVFDIKEYMNSVRENSIWAHVLGNLMRTEPFIVIGTALEESDLTFFLSQKVDSPLRSDRATSIMVEPYPDMVTESDCDEYRFALFPKSGLDFLTEIDTRFPSRPTVFQAIQENLRGLQLESFDPATIAEFHADFEQVPDQLLEGYDGGTNFAYGHQISWLDLQHNLDLSRPETSSIQSHILRDLSFKPTVIEGIAGTGKTTILRRIAWNLAHSGKKCFWLRSIGRIRVPSTLSILSRMEECYVFIDNIADHAIEASSLITQIKSKKVKFIGADRTYRMPHIDKVPGFVGYSSRSLSVIGSSLVAPLIEAYKFYGLAVSEYNKTNKFPLAAEVIAIACCRILNNYEPMQVIVDRILRDASHSERACYTFAALSAFCYRQGIEYDIISSRFLNYQVEAQEDDSAPLPLKIEIISGVEFVTPANEAMSDTILRRIGILQPVEMLEAFTSIAQAIRPRVNLPAIVSGEPSTRIVARLFDFSEIVRLFLNSELAQTFYDKTRPDWGWNSRYWHQIAQFKLDKATSASSADRKSELTREAIQHARHAKTIEANHPFTFTTIGKVIFGSMAINRQITQVELNEAIEALCLAATIEKRNKRITALPRSILFRGIIDTIKLGIPISHDQRSAIRLEMQRALEDHRRDQEVKDLVNQISPIL